MKTRRGIALVVVLALLSLLAVVLAEVAFAAQMLASTSRTRIAVEQDRLAALAAAEWSRAILSRQAAGAPAKIDGRPRRLLIADRVVSFQLEDEGGKLSPGHLAAMVRGGDPVAARSAFVEACGEMAGLPAGLDSAGLLPPAHWEERSRHILPPTSLEAYLQTRGCPPMGIGLWASPDAPAAGRPTLGGLLTGDVAGPLNVNTAPEDVLRLLGRAFDQETLMTALVRERRVRPFESLTDLRRRVSQMQDAPQALASLLGFQSLAASAVIAVRQDERVRYYRVLLRRQDEHVHLVFIVPLGRSQVVE